jgi:hypothetical protein
MKIKNMKYDFPTRLTLSNLAYRDQLYILWH